MVQKLFGKKKLKVMAIISTLVMCLTIFLPLAKLVVLAASVTGTMRMSDKTYACNISDGRGMNAKYIEQSDGSYMPVYCIEQGKRINSGDTMTRAEINNEEMGIAYICGYNNFNGWGNADSTSLISNPSVSNGNFVKYAATQIVIWEIAEGKPRNTLTSGNSSIQSAIQELYGRIDSYKAYVNSIKPIDAYGSTGKEEVALRTNKDDAIANPYPATSNEGIDTAALEAFVVNLYKGFLGRDASQADKQSCFDSITSGSITAQGLLELIYNSQEAVNYRTGGTAWSEIINGYFLAFYGANGTTADVNGWVTRLQTEGLQWNDVFNSFNGSAGWINRRSTLDVMDDCVFHFNYSYPSYYNPTNADFSRTYVNKSREDFTTKGTAVTVLSWDVNSAIAGNGVLDKVYKWYDGTDAKQQATISATIKSEVYYAAFTGTANVPVPPTPTPTPTTPPTPPPPPSEDCYVSFELVKADLEGNICRGATFGIYDDAACTKVAINNQLNTKVLLTESNGTYETNDLLDIKLGYNPLTTTSVSRTVYVKETKAPNAFYFDGAWRNGSFEQDTNIYRVELTYYPDKNGGNGKLEYKIYRTSDNKLMNPSIDANSLYGYDPAGETISLSNLTNLGLDTASKTDSYKWINKGTSFALDKALTNTSTVTGNDLSGFKFQLLSGSTVVAEGVTDSKGKTVWTTKYPTDANKTTIYNLPEGSYKLREIMPTDKTYKYSNINITIPYTYKINDSKWTEVSKGTWESEINISASNFDNAYASIKSAENYIEHCDLEITKTINSVNELTADQEFTFDVYYRGNDKEAAARDDNKKTTVKVTVPKGKKSSTVKLSDLPVGWYEVVEEEVPGYLVNYETDTLVKIEDSKSFTFKVTNSVPTIKTTLSDSVTKDHVVAERENITLTDTVTYENLVPGKEYTVTGTLMDKETGEKLLDQNGKDITASKTFKAAEVTGSIDIEFTFNSVVLENKKTIVAFEDLYYEGINVATHADINDENQTVKYPEIHTTFIDKTTNDKFVNVSETETLIDTVSYSNLVIGKEYTVTGTVMVKETGESLKDSEGNIITGSTTFVPTTEDGTVDVVFTIDTTKLKGKTLVCFEKLFLGNNLVRVHEDINDLDQTVYVPEIKTTLIDKATDDHIVAESGTITLTDTVSYSNLVPGKTYEMTGTLMVKETGESLKDSEGNPITASTEFTPESTSGTVDVVFTFDGALLGDKITLVAFEDLKYKGLTYTTHSDINDESQTVYFPNLKTTFIDEATNNQLVSRNSAAKLTDTVSYENLVPGKEYTVTGTIMVKETGEALKDKNGKVITGSTSFVPTTKDGTVDVEFTIDSSQLSEQTLVAYENLYLNGVLIRTHEDINDIDQSVSIPAISTRLIDSTTKEHFASRNQNCVLIDYVSYKNLNPGSEYRLVGKLFDRITGAPMTDSEGKEIQSEVIYKPKESEGKVEVNFSIDSSILEGKSIVAFEYLYYGNCIIAEHTDIEDTDQTVIVPMISTELTNRSNGTHLLNCSSKVELRDLVSYSNLIPGLEYTLVGRIVSKETGKYLTDTNGNIIENTINFKAENGDGIVTNTFTIDNGINNIDCLVAYEILYYNDNILAVHENLDSEAQTVYIPSISTELIDNSTNNKIVSCDRNAVLVDTISYRNLIPNNEYTIKGIIVEQTTGNIIHDSEGNEVKSTLSFVPTASEGQVTMPFVVDAEAVKGISLVSCQTLYLGKEMLCEHKSLTDSNQTVRVLSVTTEAKDSVTDSHYISSAEVSVITDYITYSNIVPGLNYSVRGQMIYSDTGETVIDSDGNPITSEFSFTPSDDKGIVDMDYIIDGNLYMGRSITIYEKIYYGDVLVSSHCDINDLAQTIRFASIETSANVNGNKQFIPEEQNSIIDSINYSNFEVGATYIVEGKLMNPDGTEFLIDGQPIIGASTFVAESETGSAEVIFDFNGRDLKNQQRIVCFEKVYREGLYCGDGVTLSKLLITSHEDINNAEQTVCVKLKPLITQTGEKLNYLRLCELTCIGGIDCCLIALIVKRRKLTEEEEEQIQ